MVTRVQVPERAGREGDQALPTKGIGDVSQLLVEWCTALGHPELAALAAERRVKGISRYGTPLQLFNGRDVCRDRVEELLDGAAYTLQAQGQYLAVVEALLVLAKHVRRDIAWPPSLQAAMALVEKLEGGT